MTNDEPTPVERASRILDIAISLGAGEKLRKMWVYRCRVPAAWHARILAEARRRRLSVDLELLERLPPGVPFNGSTTRTVGRPRKVSA